MFIELITKEGDLLTLPKMAIGVTVDSENNYSTVVFSLYNSSSWIVNNSYAEVESLLKATGSVTNGN